MSEVKHTPGPWVNVNGNLIRGPHGEPIASTVGFAYPKDVNHNANAELIAKAPEMALELERLRVVNAELVKACKEAWKYPKKSEYWIEKVASALDKAEGRQ